MDHTREHTLLAEAADEVTRAHHAHLLAATVDDDSMVAHAKTLTTAVPAMRASILALAMARRFRPALGVARALSADPHPHVRANALRMLASVATRDDESPLAALVLDDDTDTPDVAAARRALAVALRRDVVARALPTSDTLDEQRHAIVSLLESSALPELDLIEALRSAQGSAQRVVVAALGTLTGDALSRALGAALAVVDDTGRRLVIETARRVNDALDAAAREALARLIEEALSSSSEATTTAAMAALADLAPARAVQAAFARPRLLGARAILDEIARAAAHGDGGKPFLVTLLDVAERAPAALVAMAGVLDVDALIDALVDDALRERVTSAWRRASTEPVLAAARVGVVPFARLAALVGRDDGALPLELARALSHVGTEEARLALVELAGAHEDEEAARVLVDLCADESAAVSRAAHDAAARFVSRAVRIDVSTSPPSIVLDHRAPSGELLIEHGAFLVDAAGTRYALDERGAPAPLRERGGLACACCRRARLLVVDAGGARCPITGARHVRDGARAVLAASHPTGACASCATDLPLVEDGEHLRCPACGVRHTMAGVVVVETPPAPTEAASPLEEPVDRVAVGVPPAPRPVELALFRPIPKHVIASHVFLATSNRLLGAGLVLSLEEDSRTVTALVAAHGSDIGHVRDDDARLYFVNGERAPVTSRVIDEELGLAVVTSAPRRIERIALVHHVGVWPARTQTALVPGGSRDAAWEVEERRLVLAHGDVHGARARLKPGRHHAGAGVYTTMGGLVGVVFGDETGSVVISLGRVVQWLAAHESALAELLRGGRAGPSASLAPTSTREAAADVDDDG